MAIEIVRSLDTLFPPFADVAEKFAKLVEPIDMYIFETYRSFERQMECYQQGREFQNGVWVVTDPKAVVTKAKPGMSFHAYGLAWDTVADGDDTKAGVQWSWGDTYKAKDGTIQKIQWKKMGSIAKSLGLEWAGDWVQFTELPHVQNRYGFKISELYPILTTEGIEAVWKKVMTKVPASPNVVAVVAPVVIPPVVVAKPTPIPVATAEEMDTHTNVNADVNSGLLSLIGEIIKAILSAFAKK